MRAFLFASKWTHQEMATLLSVSEKQLLERPAYYVNWKRLNKSTWVAVWRNAIVPEKDKQALFLGGSPISFENVPLVWDLFCMIAELHAQSFFWGEVCIFIIVASTQVLGALILVPLSLPESLINEVLCVCVCAYACMYVYWPEATFKVSSFILHLNFWGRVFCWT